MSKGAPFNLSSCFDDPPWCCPKHRQSRAQNRITSSRRHLTHRASGASSRFRPYTTPSGHLQIWLNRDPIKERGGINLYEFVSDNPVSVMDAFGHEDILLLDQILLAPGHKPPTGFHYCGDLVTPNLGYLILYCRDKPRRPLTPPPSPPQNCPDTLAKDPYGCWEETDPNHLPQPGGPVAIPSCLARQTGCYQCCDRKFPINGTPSSETSDWYLCYQSCADNWKRCVATKK